MDEIGDGSMPGRTSLDPPRRRRGIDEETAGQIFEPFSDQGAARARDRARDVYGIVSRAVVRRGRERGARRSRSDLPRAWRCRRIERAERDPPPPDPIRLTPRTRVSGEDEEVIRGLGARCSPARLRGARRAGRRGGIELAGERHRRLLKDLTMPKSVGREGRAAA